MIKKCPRCGNDHRKKGTFCSRSCANVRVHSQKDKDIRREKLLRYHETPESAATREKASRSRTAYNKGLEYNAIPQEDYAVEVPEIRGDIEDYDMFDNYEKAEKW
jgi:hypothetical protein